MLKISLLGLFFGTIGTTLGGIIGVLSKKNSNKFLSFILAVASGLMLAVVCFDLIPEALKISSIYLTLLGIILGIIMMIGCEELVNRRFNKDKMDKNMSLLKTGIIVSVGLAVHNIPEGLAIGSGFDASITLGYALAIAICLHDVPEGISMAIPMKSGGMAGPKVMFYVILSGIATGIGALIGALIGNISTKIIAICLAFAAGAMLYVVSGELVPESNKLYHGRMTALGNMLGFIVRTICYDFRRLKVNKKYMLIEYSN